MEIVHGKRRGSLDACSFAERLVGYHKVLIDVGTGDGRYPRSVARACPECFVIGLDACRETFEAGVREKLPNLLYVVANALALPAELEGCATGITINFPWGSLLQSLIAGDPRLLDGLRLLARPAAIMEIRLNAGALVEAGLSLEAGGGAVCNALQRHGMEVGAVAHMDRQALRACQTTWAKRLAFGRDPRALYLRTVPLDAEKLKSELNGTVRFARQI